MLSNHADSNRLLAANSVPVSSALALLLVLVVGHWDIGELGPPLGRFRILGTTLNHPIVLWIKNSYWEILSDDGR